MTFIVYLGYFKFRHTITPFIFQDGNEIVIYVTFATFTFTDLISKVMKFIKAGNDVLCSSKNLRSKAKL